MRKKGTREINYSMLVGCKISSGSKPEYADSHFIFENFCWHLEVFKNNFRKTHFP